MNSKSHFAVAFVLSLLTSVALAANDPHSGPAMNYHVIDDSLATSGHFVGEGAERLALGGLQVIIDLREDPPKKSAGRLAELGIEYVHTPVSWRAPQPGDFGRFRRVLEEHRAKRVLVQCAANYRASAMTYLYRVVVEEVPEEEARQDRTAVWQLNDTWRRYVEEVLATEAPIKDTHNQDGPTTSNVGHGHE